MAVHRGSRANGFFLPLLTLIIGFFAGLTLSGWIAGLNP